MKKVKTYEYPFLNPELPLKKRVGNLVSLLTLQEKVGLLPATQSAIPRLGIRESQFGTEVARGYVSREESEISTVFPQPIGLASTFDPDLMSELGEICGVETRIHSKKYPHEKLMVWGPTVDLCRDPRWGRNEESYGEDPFLTGEMTAAYTKGMVGSHSKYLRVLCGLKHFCANNHEEDRLRDSANVDTRLLREYYYAAFEPSVRAGGAHSVMTAYNELSGVPAMINDDLKKVCKAEWGMLFAVTDGGDFTQNVYAHKYSESHAQTLALALKAGNNIMTDMTVTTLAAAKSALKSGLVTERDLDKAVSEVLTGRFMLGEFDPPNKNPYNKIPDEKLNCDEYKAVNSRAAHECVTLLQNNGILPIKDKSPKILVAGLHANTIYKDWYTGISSYNVTILDGLRAKFGENVEFHDGCNIIAIKSVFNNRYLRVKSDGSVVADSEKVTKACRFKKVDWGNGESESDTLYISEANGKLLRLSEDDIEPPLSQEHVGLVTANGNDTFEWFGRMILKHTEDIVHKSTYKTWRNKDIAVLADGRLAEVESAGGVTKSKMFEEEIITYGYAECNKLAKNSDFVVICVGNDPMVTARECFDRKSLSLPNHQEWLIDSLCNNNKNCILTVVSSYPYVVDNVGLSAVLYTAHSGPEIGNAIADVITGEYNPAGRTPQTWYHSERDLPSIKDYDIMYSRSTYMYFDGEPLFPFGHGLSYSKFEYSDFAVKETAKNIEVTLNVKNASDIDGQEVVQIYFTALTPRVKRPKKQLCEFLRQEIGAGQTVEFSFKFSKDRLRYWDVTRGKFAVESGDYRFLAAASSEDIRCTADLKVKGEKIPTRDLTKSTPAIDFDDRRAVLLRYAPKLKRHYIHSPKWNGALDFYDVSMFGTSGLEVTASLDVNDGKIAVFIDDEQVGEIIVPASANPTEFKKRKVVFENTVKIKKGKLTLKMTEFINLLDIRIV
ncbi:MAG: glycoside hydrolase family 3 C-terminal domain-containing protein [Oscillospiraceae bacterium]|nr:glycoside hydrolase family 3 C-terminal domain-containing protein [Oscillospiraceae bacterium]